MATVRETNGRARLYGAAFQQFGTSCRIVGHDANARDVVVEREPATCFQLTHRQRRIQQGVVDHLRDVFVRVSGVHSGLATISRRFETFFRLVSSSNGTYSSGVRSARNTVNVSAGQI